MSTEDVNIAIIGAGISGLAVSYHLHHEGTVLFDSVDYYSGHTHSEIVDGFTWDDGPHISFSVNKYVQAFFEDMVDGQFEEVQTIVSNYYRGHWIGHPSQVHLFQVPEPLRSECLKSFLDTRDDDREPQNYQDWLDLSYGPVFANTFPAAYTRKYWTVEPRMLTTDWVGNRMMKPSVDQVTRGAVSDIGMLTSNYLQDKKTRYPSNGGYEAYTTKMTRGADMRLSTEVRSVNFGKRQMVLANGTTVNYKQLVSTMPLKRLIHSSVDAPADVRDAAGLLTATVFLRVDVAVNHPAIRPETWLYVYDEDKFSVRISVMEKFAPSNAPKDCTAIQVEVYGSEYRDCPTDYELVKRTVVQELIEMGMIESAAAIRYINCKFVPQGNPIFDHNRGPAMSQITDFLDHHGVHLVGRYAEHKYLMTDACVISARRTAARIHGGDGAEHDGAEVFLSAAG